MLPPFQKQWEGYSGQWAKKKKLAIKKPPPSRITLVAPAWCVPWGVLAASCSLPITSHGGRGVTKVTSVELLLIHATLVMAGNKRTVQI